MSDSDQRTRAGEVYAIVGRIPRGRVTTYGAIAREIGLVRGARQVGWIMHGVPDELDLPCHRVVSKSGFLSAGWRFGHPDVMRDLLLADGVRFRDHDGYVVDMEQCFWDPAVDLDSTAADEVDDLDPVAR
jgi:methylated-DNA-protein-cysteine methyltransferase-like protein